MKKLIAILLVFFSAFDVYAQVDAIKSSSSSNSAVGERSSGRGAAGFADFFVYLLFDNVIPWQQQVLQKKTEIPELVSLELRLQTGLQPSTYYLALPRIRANWGLFLPIIGAVILLNQIH